VPIAVTVDERIGAGARELVAEVFGAVAAIAAVRFGAGGAYVGGCVTRLDARAEEGVVTVCVGFAGKRAVVLATVGGDLVLVVALLVAVDDAITAARADAGRAGWGRHTDAVRHIGRGAGGAIVGGGAGLTDMGRRAASLLAVAGRTVVAF